MKNRVGLGTFPLADVFSHIDKKGAIKLLQQFVDKGGYYIDTAPMYGFGEVEKYIGEAFKGYKRESYYLATKCMYIDVEGKTFATLQKSGKYQDVLKECDRSLERLKTDYIDLYFVHSPDPNTPVEETREALEKLQKDRKIKEIGVSNVNLEELKEYNKTGKVKYVQNRFSLINRSIVGGLKDYMLGQDIKLVPYQVIDRGQLTGKVFEDIGKLRKEDLRIGRSDWLPEKVNVIADWSKKHLAPIAKKLGVTLGQLSIAWALRQEFMGFVIVGNTNQEYTEINLKANDIKLDEDTLKEIEDAYKVLEKDVKDKFGQTLREFRGLNEKYY